MAGKAQGTVSPPRRATMSDVAARVGVSVMTVSNVINQPHLVAERTRARVQSAMRHLNYRNNLVARSLRLAEPREIGCAISQQQPGDQYMDGFLHDLARSCQAQGRNLILVAEEQEGGELDAYEDLYYGQSVAGFVIAQIAAEDRRPWELDQRDIPFVAYGETSARGEVPWSLVKGDGKRGIEMAVDHLVTRGHSELAFVGSDEAKVDTMDRLAGYRDACARHGLRHSLRPSRVIATKRDIEAGAIAAGQLLTSAAPPTALVCVTDRLAAGAVITARELSLIPGRDIAITGFGDTPLTAFGSVGITSVRQHSFAIAQALIEILLDRPDGPRHVLIEPKLVVRSSSDPSRHLP